MIRYIYMRAMIDKRRGDLLGIVPSTIILCHQYESNSTILSLKVPEDIDVSTYEISIIFKSDNQNLGYIVLPEGVLDYSLSSRYTSKRNLEVQYIFRDKITKRVLVRSNIVKFLILKSISPANDLDQAISILLDLINNGDLIVYIEDGNLIIKDSEGNILLTYPVDYEDTDQSSLNDYDNIIINSKGSSIYIYNDPYIISNSIKYHKVIYKLDSSWKGFDNLKASMYQPSVNRDNPILVDIVNNISIIPKECLTKDDYLYLSIYGYINGEIRKVSNYVYTYIHEGTK